MSPAVEVVWSGALERAGANTFAKSGLSSPLIGSTAKLGMAIGSHPNAEQPLVLPKWKQRSKARAVCFSCRVLFKRTYREKVCVDCFRRLHAARRFER